MKILLLGLVCLVSSSVAHAGFANDLSIAGKVTDFDETMVCILTRNGVELQLPRKLVSEKIRLLPGKKIFLSVSVNEFNRVVKVRLKPRHKL
jgi:RNase P/RNase MRP subunit p29